MRVYNFSAGPSMLFEETLTETRDNMLSYKGSGLCVAEMSHRSKDYSDIHAEFIETLRELMQIPENYAVLLLQGGASQQFDAAPLNLLRNGKADYVITGHWSERAFAQAAPLGDIAAVATSKESVFTYIPELPPEIFREGTDYVHITTNNTIYGTRYTVLPDVKSPLVADASSGILSEYADISKFGVIYAGAQKNIGPAGLTVVIIRKDLIYDDLPRYCPKMLKYSTQANADSLFNTPPCMTVYMSLLNLRQLKKLGGISAIQKINEEKASLLYDFIDNSDFYKNNVKKKDRSLMNVPFLSPNADLDKKFIKEAASDGLLTLGGHKTVGGMRASVYNAMPVEGVKKLIEFMKKFERDNKN
ncbi:MAG: 3-phosphoserine/phosphohydroxythreonine transaminase [Clostridiales bacterium]|jgi:phosphoserine aminotransferase|nr:3-phosphoserine/phosphohydroxythreonine transaminase [Clostridiales bacterium]